MKQIVLRSPVVLYETVEALYQHVNGLSVEGRKRDLLQKFGSKLTRTEREQIEQSCALAAKVAEAACTGLEDGPALETFFRKWETESKWQNTCLAKLMIFSFLDIRTTDLEQSLQRTRQSAEERLNGSYLLRDINSGGISFSSPTARIFPSCTKTFPLGIRVKVPPAMGSTVPFQIPMIVFSILKPRLSIRSLIHS